MNIVIYGLGYVGLTAAACLAKEGHSVIGVDVNAAKVAEINAGRSPITEPGLAELLDAAVADGSLKAKLSAQNDIKSADMAIVCVGTPSAPGGAHNMTHIAEVSRQIASDLLQDRSAPITVVYRSTLRPGSIESLVAPIFSSILGAQKSALVELIYNPEFLREATAIHDYFNPPKIVIGTRDAQPNPNMDLLYAGINGQKFYTNYREAEITKFVDNTWHALKVGFANEIGRVCLSLDIDPARVHEIFVSDTKLNISSYYLRPGGAFGGSCLPKDVRALQHLSNELSAHTNIIDALMASNESHKQFLYDYCTSGLKAGASILISGLAFKANSDDLRESPNVDLAVALVRAGYDVSIIDSSISTQRLFGQNLGYTFTHLPQLASMLVEKGAVEGKQYDLLVDTNGDGQKIRHCGRAYVDISRLRLET